MTCTPPTPPLYLPSPPPPHRPSSASGPKAAAAAKPHPAVPAPVWDPPTGLSDAPLDLHGSPDPLCLTGTFKK